MDINAEVDYRNLRNTNDRRTNDGGSGGAVAAPIAKKIFSKSPKHTSSMAFLDPRDLSCT